MSSRLTTYLRNYSQRQHVRPYALLAPILILLLALPLLRPLRQPNVTPEEAATLTAVQSMVERASPFTTTTPVDHPVYVFLLAGPYWLMSHAGVQFAHNPILAAYLLTIVGVTLPAAMSAGLIYRMGRLFELRRPWRTALSLACVLSSGLFSYATALNPQAPAAFAILWACACLIQVATVGEPARSGVWLTLAGLLAATAAVIEPASLPFLLLLPLVILAMRWTWSLRAAGVIVYALGALPPLVLHVALIAPDPIHRVQIVLHDSQEFLLHGPQSTALAPAPTLPDDLDDAPKSPVLSAVGDVTNSLLGPHGLLSHFPLLALSVFGIAAVMHRHWPTPTKMLAGVTAASSVAILLAYTFGMDPRPDASFASRWFIVFSPALLFWAGAWLRRSHRPATWSLVGTLCAFSTIVSLIGAANPLPPAGYHDTYTPVTAIRTLTHQDPPKSLTTTIGTVAPPEN